MGQYQIFISYRRDGGDALAGRIADRFNALGYKVFFDVESMRSGAFNLQLLDALEQCSDVLLVLPPKALDRCVNKDDWVRKELEFALKKEKNIIPIMMRGFEFPAEMPKEIEKIRYMEGATASSEYFDAVISRIESFLVCKKPKDNNPNSIVPFNQNTSAKNEIGYIQSAGGWNEHDLWPTSPKSSTINKDLYSVVSFQIVMKNKMGYKGNAVLEFAVFDEMNNMICSDDTDIAIQPDYDKFATLWVLKDSQGTSVNDGVYKATFRVNGSSKVEYKFRVVSDGGASSHNNSYENTYNKNSKETFNYGNNGVHISSNSGERSFMVYLVLCLLLGAYGVHSFYIGKTKKGFFQFLLSIVGIGFIWALIDLIKAIITRKIPS